MWNANFGGILFLMWVGLIALALLTAGAIGGAIYFIVHHVQIV